MERERAALAFGFTLLLKPLASLRPSHGERLGRHRAIGKRHLASRFSWCRQPRLSFCRVLGRQLASAAEDVLRQRVCGLHMLDYFKQGSARLVPLTTDHVTVALLPNCLFDNSLTFSQRDKFQVEKGPSRKARQSCLRVRGRANLDRPAANWTNKVDECRAPLLSHADTAVDDCCSATRCFAYSSRSRFAAPRGALPFSQRQTVGCVTPRISANLA